MLLKNYFLVFILTFFVAGFFFLALPDKGFAQRDWCCNNNSTDQCVASPNAENNCDGSPLEFFEDGVDGIVLVNPQCEGDSPGSGDLCVVRGCGGPPPVKTSCQCRTGDFTCPCEDLPCTAPQTGCCSVDDSGLTCTSGIELATCEGMTGFVDGDWQPGPQTCNTIDQCAPEPPQGCCSVDDSGLTCTPGIIEVECEAMTGFMMGDWTQGSQTCNSLDQCASEPGTGCCSVEFESNLTCNAGILLTACEAMDGFVDGDWQPGGQTCNSLDQCASQPGTGCCAIEDPISCNAGLTEVECADISGFVSGDWQQGPQTCNSIDQCAAEPPPITANIPTIGQWGMIAMAGLLGIFSLFIIMRRHRYNVS